VRIYKCQEKNATVVWMPGSYNNAPVQYYIVQYNTTFAPDTWTFALKVRVLLSSRRRRMVMMMMRRRRVVYDDDEEEGGL
jgi:hypothetical protein